MPEKESIDLIINTPHIGNSGGVANFYRNLAPHFGANILLNEVTYPNDQKPSPLQQIGLFIKFIGLLRKHKSAKVLLNPSFNFKSARRDNIYIRIAKLYNREVHIFWHGWDKQFYEALSLKDGKGFTEVYNYPSTQFVLASEFKDQLANLGVSSEVELATTCVDNSLIEGAQELGGIQPKTQIKKLLFISRIEKVKGIFETVDAFAQLQQKHPDIELNIAGTGGAFEELQAYIKGENIQNINLLGYVRNEEKLKCYLENDALVFPTYHGEGMPLTLLESLSFGLVIITTDIGGIKDFFNDKMGALVEPQSVDSVVKALTPLMENPESVEEISKFNFHYAIEKYQAKDVAKRLVERIL